jgi:hypothetical protein
MTQIIVVHMMLFFTILRQIWLEDPMRWTQHFSNTSPILHDLANGFQLISSHNIAFEHLRNDGDNLYIIILVICFHMAPEGQV